MRVGALHREGAANASRAVRVGALRREGAANASRALRVGALRREGAGNASRAVRVGELRREGVTNASRAVRVGESSAGRARLSSGCTLSAADRFIRKQDAPQSGRRGAVPPVSCVFASYPL